MNSLSIVTWILALCVWGAPPDRTESPFPLHDAIANGDLDEMKSVLARGIDVNRTNDQGQTALQCALKTKRSDFVQALLEHKADPNTVTTREKPPLIIAAETGDVESLKLLIKFGALIRVHDFDGHTAGHMALRHNKQAQQSLELLLSADPQLALERGWLDYTLIHQAVSDNRIWAIATLAQLGTPIDVPNSNGQTAIYLAATNGQLDCVKVLLANKADPNGAMGVYVPLLSACERGHIDIAKLLIGAGGNLNPQRPPNMLVSNHNLLVAATQSGNIELVAYLVEKGAPKPAPDQWRQAAAASGKPEMIEAINRHTGNADAESPRVADAEVLAAAANRKSTDALKLLLKNGGNPNAVDQRGMTALMIAVDDGKPEHVEMLLAAGADVSTIDIYGRMALHIAAQRNNIDMATPLLAAGAPIEATDKHGQTPLACAARRIPNAVAVRSLLKAGANPNVRDHDGSTPLINSANINESELVELLLQHGADPNATDKEGNTAILHAVTRNAQSVRALIQAGAKLDVVTKDGSTLLHKAARHSRADVVELLLKNGLDINLTDRYGNSPIHCAAAAADPDVLRHLIEHGAALMAAAGQGTPEVIRILVQAGAEINAVDNSNETALHLAVRLGNQIANIESLCQAGADPNIKTKDGRTPLAYLCRDRVSESEPKATAASARLLISAGADPDSRVAGALRVLQRVIENNQTELAIVLLEAGADPNAILDDGITPLMLAMSGDAEIVKALLRAGADINARNERGFNALMVASSKTSPQTIVALIEAGIDLNATNAEGDTALIRAARSDNEAAVVVMLIEAGAAIDKANLQGETALMHAVQRKTTEHASALLAAGADVDARTATGRTPLHFAAAKASAQAITMLLKSCAQIEARDHEHHTPLMHALQNTANLNILISHGANVNAADRKGMTVLMMAAQRRNLTQVQLLVDAGADFLRTDADGRTALDWATGNGEDPKNQVSQFLKAKKVSM
jgi:ankyrin repeat protein